MAEGYISTISRSKIFNDALTQRDTFLGTPRCVVCGADDIQSCYIIAPSFSGDWHMEEFKSREWIPLGVKEPQYELRNGLIMCPNHCALFDRYHFFIRFVPKWEKFVLVNYSNNPDLAQYHGKAIGLDIEDSNAPFPTLFIIHEFRVRGHQPFAPIEPEIGDCRWQDWILASSVFNESSGSFKRERPLNEFEEYMTGNPSGSGLGSGSGLSQSQPGLNINPVTNNQKVFPLAHSELFSMDMPSLKFFFRRVIQRLGRLAKSRIRAGLALQTKIDRDTWLLLANMTLDDDSICWSMSGERVLFLAFSVV